MLFCCLTGFGQIYRPHAEKWNSWDNKSDTSYRGEFLRVLKACRITYKIPKGYKPQYYRETLYQGRTMTLGTAGVDHQLISKKEDIAIAFDIFEIDTASEPAHFLKALGGGRSINTNYIKGVKYWAKRPNEPRRYDKSYTIKNFNADDAGTYEVEMLPGCEYKCIFKKCRIVFIHKESRGDITLFYFYNEKKSDDKIDAYIRKTRKMIKFDD